MIGLVVMYDVFMVIRVCCNLYCSVKIKFLYYCNLLECDSSEYCCIKLGCEWLS